ncbi:hypothetical protein MAR_026081 [Mya arenaria]|uniref:PH domain-containing protein n=1 Tax=Mya arenaria TaxID=6604 RepID=A0ABY7ET56_MYAAR|nr:hypothetical protein MAR_026081 [Mya arenaria]
MSVVKEGYVKRHSKSLFSGGWNDVYLKLYSDSNLLAYKKKGDMTAKPPVLHQQVSPALIHPNRGTHNNRDTPSNNRIHSNKAYGYQQPPQGYAGGYAQGPQQNVAYATDHHRKKKGGLGGVMGSNTGKMAAGLIGGAALGYGASRMMGGGMGGFLAVRLECLAWVDAAVGAL